jgi:hypothetical protein
MTQRRKPILSAFRRKIADKKIEHDAQLDRDLNDYSIKLIKVVGVIGIIIGFAIIIAFWYWVIKMLYKIG